MSGMLRWTTALSVVLGLILTAVAAAAVGTSFSGRTAQGLSLSFRESGSTVVAMKTAVNVLCITAYPASGSQFELFPFAPRAPAKLVGNRFTMKMPTLSKGHFATLTGVIHGNKASGSLTVDYDKSGNVLNPATGYYV